MPRDHTEFEDALQVKPADLDLRILESFRGGAIKPAAAAEPVPAAAPVPEVAPVAPPAAVATPGPARAPEPVVDLEEEPEPADDDQAEDDDVIVTTAPAGPNGGAWTIPLVCLGLGIIAMALIIPAADENRRLVYERERLARDLGHIEKQIALNDEFLARLATDPGLAERLAQRQMKMVREGTSVLQLPGRSPAGPEVSPYELVTLPPPPPLPDYRPIGGQVSRWFHHPKVRLYLLGAGMLSLVLGVILGSARRRPEDDARESPTAPAAPAGAS